MQIVVILGPAGSGKTTLTAAFAKWIKQEQAFNVGIVNLDPGVKILPYNPIFDVRKIVTVDLLMEEKGLGPNGAFLECMKIISEECDRIISKISSEASSVDFLLVDTPGQMEPFIFTEAGPRTVSEFKKLGPVVGVLLVDPTLTRAPSDITVAKLLTAVIELRLDVPTVLALNKADQVNPRILELFVNSQELVKEIETSGEGFTADLSLDLNKVLDRYSSSIRRVVVSAKSGSGLKDLYDAIHEVFCTCGDHA